MIGDRPDRDLMVTILLLGRSCRSLLTDGLQEVKPDLLARVSRIFVDIFYNAMAIDHLPYQICFPIYYYAIVNKCVGILTILSLF